MLERLQVGSQEKSQQEKLQEACAPRRRALSWVSRFAEPRILLGGGFLCFLLVVAVAAPVLAPKDPLEQDLVSSLLAPASLGGSDPSFLLGADDLGRDVLSRLIYGSQTALFVAVVAASLACIIGATLGLLAGWYRGVVDVAISRLVEIWMAFPPVLLSILLVAVLGSGLHSVIAAIVIIDWTRFCRVVRAETMSQAAKDYVTAARTVGFSRFVILAREILPNVVPIIITLLSLEMGIAVIVEAILSFVGLSVSSDVPTWGGMIAQGRQILHEGWWVFAAPLAALFATVLAFNILGEGLQRALDPVRQR
jgi:dipeptide transport system permease protein